MKIKLNKKTYTTKRIKAIKVREAFEMIEMIGKRVTLSKLDEMVRFVISVFDNQFTEDELYNGLEADELYKTLYGIIIGLTNGVSEKLESKNAEKAEVEKS